MPPMKKTSRQKKITKPVKSKSRRRNDCCDSETSSSSSYDDSSSDFTETSSESESSDCCDCSDSDCSDCWECDVPSRKRGGNKTKPKTITSKAPHKGRKKPQARRSKYSTSCNSSSCESSDDCYECVPKKPGRKARV